MDSWAIGLDVGGTKIAGGLVRFSAAEVVGREVVPTRPERGPAAVLADLGQLARRLHLEARSAGRVVRGVGVGVPELVDLQGRVTSAQTLDWRGVDLAKQLGVPAVRVEADVRAAALAEARFGAGRPYRQFVYLSVGTGISATLVLDGVPHAGARGNALIAASGPLTTLCRHCQALSDLVPEEISSGLGLVRRYQALQSDPVPGAAEVLRRAEQGDVAAIRVVREGGAVLGGLAAWLVNVLDPEALVIGGGLGLTDGLYRDAFQDALRHSIWAEASRSLPVLNAALGPDAGLIGAAAAALEPQR